MTAITVALYVIAALVLGVCLLKNVCRSTLRSSVNLIATVLCAAGAALWARALSARVSTALCAVLLDGQAELAASLPSLCETAAGLIGMLAAPILFALCFLGLQIVVAIVCAVVLGIIEKRRPAITARTRAVGALLAVVSTAVILVVCLTPMAGYTSYLPDVLASSAELTEQSESTLSAEDAAELAAHPVLAASRTLGGQWLFNQLARATVFGTPTTLESEYRTASALLEDVLVLAATPIEDYGDAEEAAMLAVADHAEASPIVRTLAAEAAKGFSSAWLDGQPFLGVEQPDLGVGMNLALEAGMIVMEQTTPETFPADLRALTPALFTAIKTVYTIENMSDSSSFSAEDLQTVIDVIANGSATDETREALIRAGVGLAAKELADLMKPAEPAAPTEGGEIVLPDEEIVIDLPGENDVTEAEYDAFVRALTDLVVESAMSGDRDGLVEKVKALRDTSGLSVSDEECEALIDNVLSGPFGALFGR